MMRALLKLATAFAAVMMFIIATGCAAPSAATPPPPNAEVDLDRIICHDTAKTGTRMTRKTCKTAREWEEEAFENQEAGRNVQRRPAPRSDLPTMGN